MEKLGKRFGILLAAVLLLAIVPAVSTKAAEYTYTVRFYAGKQGTFADGRDVITYKGLKYGAVVSFNPGSVVLRDGSKYYVKGIRESGKDNNTVAASAFTVTDDRDYVVAYGLRGDTVAYTVHYVDTGGNKLAPSDTYYGNAGDKPVVAFVYIDGYQPQAYNLTKTLVKNEAENVFTFVYTPIAGSVTKETTTKTVEPKTTTRTVEPKTTRQTVEVIEGEDRSERDSGQGGDDGKEDAIDSGFPAAGTASSEPRDTIDLDAPDGIPDGIFLEDPAVPLADMKLKIGPFEVDARLLFILTVIIISTLTVAGASWWYWKPYWKKGKKENEK